MIASEILNSEFLDLPPLNAMRAFEAVARLGGVAAAADELGVTSGAVSQQIKLLETVLGAKLVKRSGRGIGLTAEGRAVATLSRNRSGVCARRASGSAGAISPTGSISARPARLARVGWPGASIGSKPRPEAFRSG